MGIFSRSRAPQEDRLPKLSWGEKIAMIQGHGHLTPLGRNRASGYDNDGNFMESLAEENQKKMAEFIYQKRKDKIARAMGFKDKSALGGIHWLRRRKARQLAKQTLYQMIDDAEAEKAGNVQQVDQSTVRAYQNTEQDRWL